MAVKALTLQSLFIGYFGREQIILKVTFCSKNLDHMFILEYSHGARGQKKSNFLMLMHKAGVILTNWRQFLLEKD